MSLCDRLVTVGSDALWDAATDPQMPTGVVEIEGRRYPLVEFEEDSAELRRRYPTEQGPLQ